MSATPSSPSPVWCADLGALEARVRRAARVLPVDDDGAVLLLRCIDPARPAAPFLITVGGGIEQGESEREAAARELWEETGLVVAPDDLVGPVHSDSFTAVWGSEQVTQHQNYYLMAARDAAVVFDNLVEIELDTVIGHGWWTAGQLRLCDDVVWPEVQRAVDAATATLDRLRRS